MSCHRAKFEFPAKVGKSAKVGSCTRNPYLILLRRSVKNPYFPKVKFRISLANVRYCKFYKYGLLIQFRSLADFPTLAENSNFALWQDN